MPTPVARMYVDAARSSEPAVLAAALAHLTGDIRWAEDARLSELRDWRAGIRKKLGADGQSYLEDAARELETIAQNGLTSSPVTDSSVLLCIARHAIDTGLDERFIQKLQHHLDPDVSKISIDRDAIHKRKLRVTIIGAGMSGIGMAFALDESGIEYNVLEMGTDLGGVWYDNVYPECGVDTQAFQYAFEAEPNLDWTRFDVKRDEILDYIRAAADKRGVTEHVHFGVKVEKGTWVAEHSAWRLDVLHNGCRETRWTDVLIVAVGSLNRPKIPEVPGADTFAGQTFHTSRWRDDLELEGKRIALIGSGSSGVQVARSVAQLASEMYVFVRSPHWIRPRRLGETGEVSTGKRWLLANLPNYLAWYRFYLDFVFGDREHRRMILSRSAAGLAPGAENDETRAELTNYIRSQLGEREDLIRALTPSYPPYAKRLVVDNSWYKTLTEPHVKLVTSQIVSLDETGINTADGSHFDVDVLGYATGFHGTRYFWPLDLVGCDGKNLAATFHSDDDLRAYLGVTMAGYPNLFSLQGPNSSIGHGGGATFMSEGQGRFILATLKIIIEGNYSSATIKPEVVEEYNAFIDKRLDEMVWTAHGVSSRFQNSRGRVITNHPFTLLEFWERTQRVGADMFILDPATEMPRSRDAVLANRV